MNAYQEKQAARRGRLEARADKKHAESDRRLGAARETADLIPLGQPILVGHHSEGRHRRDIARIQNNTRKGIEAHHEGNDLQRRADAVGRGGISSDDPEAVTQLREKIAGLREADTLAKAMNKAARAARKKAGGKGTKADRGRDLLMAGVNAAFAVDGAPQALKKRMVSSLNAFPWPPDLGTNATEIRRCEKRIASLLEQSEDETTETETHGVTITDNVEENRLQLTFPGKPSPAIRARLKSAGFRWARSLGVWQRHRSNVASYKAQVIVEAYGAEVPA